MNKKRLGERVPEIDVTDFDRLFVCEWANKGTPAQVLRIAMLISRDRILHRLRAPRPTADIIVFPQPPRE